MQEQSVTWDTVTLEASRIKDRTAELERLTQWPPDRIDQEAAGLAALFGLAGALEGRHALLEIFKMRESVRISDAISDDLQYQLLQAMWLRRWSIDETKQALPEIAKRLRIAPPTISRQINVVLEIALVYHRMVRPDRWAKREDRARFAELMWLTGWDEEQAFKETTLARDRFSIAQGEEDKAINALCEIEMSRRVEGFGAGLPEKACRRLAEIMWMRRWPLERTLDESVDYDLDLGLRDELKAIDALHEVCLLCGPCTVHNAIAETCQVLFKREALTPDQSERSRMFLAECMWLNNLSLSLTIEKVMRFARVNKTTPYRILESMVEVGRQFRRQRAESAMK